MEMDGSPSLKWSATLNVASPTTYAKGLNGDKMILPQSALEQLLAASSSSSSNTTSTMATASNPFYNPYASTSISTSTRAPYAFDGEPYQQLPSPLMFRLVNPSNGNAIYAGIREFSAEEGEVLLSPYLIEALGIDLNRDLSEEETALPDNESTVHQITIHAKHLPKGTYVRLRPLEAGYNPDDWKSLLERKLRESFTTLTNGAILSVPDLKGEVFRLLVDGFRPEGDGICVVNTDLEVDIEALDEAQARETMRQIMTRQQRAPGTAGGSSVGHEVNIWKSVDGQVLPGDYVHYELPSWARSRVLEIEISELQDEYGVDLFVSPKSSRQRVPPRLSEHVFSVFSYTQHERKRIIIKPTNVELESAESLLISVYGYIPDSDAPSTDASPRPYRLRVKNNVMLTEAPAASSVPEPTEPERSPDEEQCKNCLQWVPKRTIILHENFCLRNNVTCPQCRDVFQKTSDEWRDHWHCPHDEAHGSSEMTKAKHDNIYHTERRCPSCPFTTNSIPDLARHRTTLCPDKIILCQFCHLEVCQEGDPFNPSAEMLHTGLTEHELIDGARTTDCHLCSKIIRLRDMSNHLKYHELEKAHRPKPPVCRNANCGRTLHGVGRNGAVNAGTRMGQGPGNDIGLCSLCFSPLYVSLYDPEGNALKRRIERRYLTQMMQGCGKRWCANEWCKTGRANLKLESKPSTAQLVLSQIKPLMNSVRDKQTPMYFCVDEANQRRRRLAEMLVAEDDWDLEWCIAACEAEGPDLDRARGWLINWAPSKE